ncbi:MAG: hypothetical protein QXF96_09070 [Saccharolobus sp.]
MEKYLSLKVLFLVETHTLYLISHLFFSILSLLLSVYSIFILAKGNGMIIPVFLTFIMYFISFVTLLFLLLSQFYNFILNDSKFVIKNIFSKKEFVLTDTRLVIGVSVGRIVGKVIITYDNKLIFKLLTLSKGVKRLKETIIRYGYRDGGLYKVCKLCGSINDLYAKKCGFCGSDDLFAYDLIWLDFLPKTGCKE